MAVEDLIARLRVENRSRFTSDLGAAASSVKGVGEAGTRASSGLSKADSSSRSAHSGFMSLRSSSRGLSLSLGSVARLGAAAAGAAGLGLLAKSAISAGISYNAFAEQQQTAFGTLLHSQKRAASLMTDLQKQAAATPFELTDLTKASQVLLGFGFNVKQTKGLLQDLGNAASATGQGAEGFGAMATIFGQIKAKGRLQGDEVLQLAERGVPAMRILQKQLGLTAEQLQDKMGKGAIDANTAIGALTKGFQGMYGGAMATQSKTFNGQVSTLKDNMSQLLGRASKPLFDYLSQTALPALNGLITGGGKAGGMMSKLKDVFMGLKIGLSGGKFWEDQSALLVTVGLAARGVREALTQIIGTAVRLGTTFYTSFSQAVGPIQPIATAILLLGKRFLQVAAWISQTAGPGIIQTVKGIATVLGGVIRIVAALIHGDWGEAWRAFKTTVSGAVQAVAGVVRTVLGPVLDIIQKIIDKLGEAARAIANSPVGKVAGAVGGVVGDVAGFLGVGAAGGTVRGPGSWITGEAGPELNTRLPGGAVRTIPFANSPAPALTGGGGDIVLHNVMTLDGQTVYDNVVRRARGDVARGGGG